MTQKNLPLGRGLAALLGDWPTDTPNESHPQITMLNLNQLVSGQYQPRQHFDEAEIDALSQSIAKQGLLQPITVRPKGDIYEILAGERRWRACQKIAKSPIPCIIHKVTDENALAIALIENLQRQNLNPIEEASALHRLIDEFHLTHQQIGEILGQSRTHITNQLRLLQLEPEVQSLLAQGAISVGHARCLVGLDTNTQIEIAEKIHLQQWSVRTTEKFIQLLNQSAPSEKIAESSQPVYEHLVQQLQNKWPLNFQIQSKKPGKGKFIISYQSQQELDKILQHLLD